MLFISIMYDSKLTDVTEKAKMYLEILGNTELRPSTLQYFINKSAELRDIVVHETNKEEGEENKLSSKLIEVDMSWLRYRDSTKRPINFLVKTFYNRIQSEIH